MQQRLLEYRYGSNARQRAALWFGISSFVLIGLVAALLVQWTNLGWLTKSLGVLFLIGLLFTIRAQFARLTYRCCLLPDQIRIVAPLSNRSVSWSSIVEVRRLVLPQLGGQQSWACTVFTESRRGNAVPIYLFDHQLEQAEDALQQIVRHTPHARHTNV
jgi:hypothetical protein